MSSGCLSESSGQRIKARLAWRRLALSMSTIGNLQKSRSSKTATANPASKPFESIESLWTDISCDLCTFNQLCQKLHALIPLCEASSTAWPRLLQDMQVLLSSGHLSDHLASVFSKRLERNAKGIAGKLDQSSELFTFHSAWSLLHKAALAKSK